jgi:amino acid transporter
LGTHGFLVEFAQFKLEGRVPAACSARLFCGLRFSGFESSTSLGDEARNPARTIPRSIIQSTLISGTFFIFMSYVIILDSGPGANLAETEAPLDFLRRGWALASWER